MRALCEEARKRGSVGSEGNAHEIDAGERPLPGFLVAGAAGIGDDEGIPSPNAFSTSTS
jgi:hypothetical protein